MKTFTREFFVEAGRRGGLSTLKRKGKKHMKKLSEKGVIERMKRRKKLSTPSA